MAAAAFVLLVLGATPAQAVITQNTIGCAGSAVITDQGQSTTVNATDSLVKVPNQGQAAYQGSIQTVTHNHRGQVALKVGPGTIPLGKWGPKKNAKNESSATGTKKLPAILKNVPPGRYDVSGYHQGDEGRCAGKVTIEIGGSPLSNPVALGSLVLTALSGLGLFAAVRAVPAKAGI
jgi:hypothetical protein